MLPRTTYAQPEHQPCGRGQKVPTPGVVTIQGFRLTERIWAISGGREKGAGEGARCAAGFAGKVGDCGDDFARKAGVNKWYLNKNKGFLTAMVAVPSGAGGRQGVRERLSLGHSNAASEID